MWRGVTASVLGIFLFVSTAGSGRAQPDTIRTVATQVVGQYQDARALAIDPLGRLYVADAGRDVVVIRADGDSASTVLGGTGTRAGEFDAPVDLDPTNGQTLLVADKGNGRIQRFSAEFQYLEALPVGTSAEQEQSVFDDGRDGSLVQGAGRPIAVVSSTGDATFVLEAQNGAVLKWDAQRRVERIIGGFGHRDGALREPVDLALGGQGRLYVADRAQQAVLAYDRFGTFVRRLVTPALPNVVGLTAGQNRLWIVCPDRFFVWNRATGRTTEHIVDFSTSLVDVVPGGDALYLLTATQLRRLPRE